MSEILTIVFSSSAALAVAAYMAKTLLGQLLQKDITVFKERLRSEHTTSIEAYKQQLNIAAKEHEITFSRIHSDRADAVAQINGLIWRAYQRGAEFVSPIGTLTSDERKEAFEAAFKAMFELIEYFETKRIYLSEELADEIDALIQKMRTPTNKLRLHMTMVERDGMDEDIDIWSGAWESFSKEVSSARNSIEKEFRTLLTPPTTSNAEQDAADQLPAHSETKSQWNY